VQLRRTALGKYRCGAARAADGSGSGQRPKTVRDLDVAAGAPRDGFTALFGRDPGPGRRVAPTTVFAAAFDALATPVPCINVLSHLHFAPLIETG